MLGSFARRLLITVFLLRRTAVVKLFLVFQDPSTKSRRTLIATGWLIAPDLIVSAGHCVFDWEHNLNQVTEIKAYIGYDGRASVGRYLDYFFSTILTEKLRLTHTGRFSERPVPQRRQGRDDV